MNDNWIFLRGLTRGNIHWGNFPEIFKKMNPNAKVEFLEIQGNGTRNIETTPIDPEEVIGLLRERSEFCKEKTKFNICGISLGGMIAMKWAELYPDEIQSITIINSSLSQYSPFYYRLKPKNYSNILYALIDKNIFHQEKIILSMTSNHLQNTKKHLKDFVNFGENYRLEKSNIARQLILASRIKVNKLPDVPFNVLLSKNDRFVDDSCSQQIASNLNGTLYTHPSAGHDLPLDDPEWLCEMLKINLSY
jgi:pimeloyl-ACP methyl ester carboxylesterase